MADEEQGALTVGIPDAIFNQTEVMQGYAQIAEVKRKGENKILLCIHDGFKKIDCVLPSQFNQVINDGGLIKNSIIMIKSYQCTTIAGHRSCVLNDIDLAQKDCEDLSQGTLVNLTGKSPAPQKRSVNKSMFGQTAPRSRANNESNGGGNGFRISALSPYLHQKNWKLKVRVTEKNDMKEWSNAKGTGKLFGFTIMDNYGDEIKVTAFNDEAEKFFNVIHLDKLYTFSRGRIKVDKFRGRVQNDYCINVDRNTVIEPIKEESGSFKTKSYTFVEIKDLEQHEKNSFVDVVGCVKECAELREFTSKAGKPLKNRKLLLVDTSGCSVECTLWNQHAEKYTSDVLKVGTVLILPGCRVGDFGGRSLSASKVLLNFKSNEVTKLEQWWKSGGETQSVTSVTVRGAGGGNQKYFNWFEAESSAMGHNPEQKDEFKGDWFNIRGTVTHFFADINKPPYYRGCPESSQNLSKVTEENGKWYCEKTGETYDSYTPRFILRFQISDPCDGKYVSTFDREGPSILNGVTATEVDKYVVAKDEDRFEDVFKSNLWKTYNFTVRAKAEVWEDQERIRYRVMGVAPIDYKMEAQKMIERLQNL